MKEFYDYNFCFKPGGVFKEDWCTVCQCINNAYVCDDSSCANKPTTENIGPTTESSYQTTVFEEFPTKEIVSTESPQKYTTEELSSTTETKQQQFTAEYTSTVKWPESTTLKPSTTVFGTSPADELSTVTVDTTTEGIIYVPSTISPPMVLCDIHQ